MARKPRRAGSGTDRWEVWWEFNKDRFLDLNSRFGDFRARSGSSGFLVGRGRKDQALNTNVVTPDIVRTQIVPSLMLSADDEDLRLRSSSVLALARSVPMQDSKAVLDLLSTELASTHLAMRQLVCLSIGVLGSDAGSSFCTDLMCNNERGQKLVGGQNVDLTTRAYAALGLGLIGSVECSSSLIEIIESADPGTEKDLIACAIMALGLLREGDTQKANAQFLVGELNDGKLDSHLRAFIPLALGKLGDRTVLQILTERLKNTKEHHLVRQSCAIALGTLSKIGDTDQIKVLTNQIKKGKDTQVKRFSLIALSRIGARDSNFEANEAEHRSLCRIYREEISKTGNSQNRSWASLAAAIHGREHPSVQPEIVECLMEAFAAANDPSEMSAEAISLGLLGAANAGTVIFQKLEDSKDRLVKGYLCIALGLMNWREAVDEIRGYLEDRSLFSLRIQAATALGLMGDRQMVDLLVAPLEQNQHLFVMAHAADALGLIGDRGAIVPLRKVLENKESGVLARSCAATALGKLGERTDMPWSFAYAEEFNFCLQLDSLVNFFSMP